MLSNVSGDVGCISQSARERREWAVLGVSFQKYMDFFRNLPELIQDKTAIYVSHRMSNCKFCDQIIVLDNGQILEEGEHETLLEK